MLDVSFWILLIPWLEKHKENLFPRLLASSIMSWWSMCLSMILTISLHRLGLISLYISSSSNISFVVFCSIYWNIYQSSKTFVIKKSLVIELIVCFDIAIVDLFDILTKKYELIFFLEVIYISYISARLGDKDNSTHYGHFFVLLEQIYTTTLYLE